MIEITKHTVTYVEYPDIHEAIEKKYNIRLTDYAGSSQSHHDETERYFAFKGFTGEWRDSQGKSAWHSGEVSLQLAADKKSGIWVESPEKPYQNFWHFLLDHIDISNGKLAEVNWAELQSVVPEDSWQREILNLFVDSFGSEPMDVMFSW
jgi:hypothetical protein